MAKVKVSGDKMGSSGPIVKIAPSILSADFSCLGEQISHVTDAGADYLHIDVMDGHFVSNITVGSPVVKSLRRSTTIPLDVHLMVEDPERQIPLFAQAGADLITVHIEACPHIHRAVEQIKRLDVKAGVAINPGTPLSSVEELLHLVDLIVVMTVDPGFGGQSFIHDMLPKISKLRDIIDERGLLTELEVDGGISTETAPIAVHAGARVLVAGAAVFGSQTDVRQAIINIRNSLNSIES